MFNHAAQVFSRKPSIKPSRRAVHLGDISIASADSASSSSSTVSSASTLPASASSSSFSSSPTAIRHANPPPNGPSSSPSSPPSIPGLNPLSQHPTFGPPPPPLSERPLIQPPAAHRDPQAAPPVASRAEWASHLAEKKVPRFPHDYSPRHSIHTSTPVSNSASTSAQDYFVLKVPPTRPELRSHWSVSTIQTPDMDCETPTGPDQQQHQQQQDEDEDDDGSRGPTPTLSPSLTPSPTVSQRDSVATASQATERAAATAPVRNFSYKRCTVGAPLSGSSYGQSPSPPSDSPRRPQMKTMDSIECWIKRGGWKRRGIVFQQAEVSAALAADN